ncbi:heme peroxidase [Dendrothele bispora CBS 962.96]|uniref:Heme peroxidase n=1 Tax=Dendrothele bispora (strain CBS 962.96) TaxID=1314807 RepID=A0A4S8LL56_DENBC|nr:heme peroxidase [Dendrothele bispora CBS 962.96]
MTTLVQIIKEKLQDVLKDPELVTGDLKTLIDAVQHPDSLNDRLLLQEKLFVLMTRLGDTNASPKQKKAATDLQAIAVDFLYKDLPHPPGAYLSALASNASTTTATANAPQEGGYLKYAYRAADASNYNPLFPNFGAARQPYARTVPSTSLFTPINTLPDPGLVFDTLFRRPKDQNGKSKFDPHPSGVSSCFFALADLIIHDIFNTNRKDWSINDNSSYLDLSVLYGSSDEQVNAIRRHDGTGRLLEDVFADNRLLLMPPATCALLVLFSRNHNFIAQKILNINERGNLQSPSSLTSNSSALKSQDDEIFHRARLVNAACYIKIILGDYVGAILGQVRDRSDWRLDTLAQSRTLGHDVSPRGEGNVVSIEFNLLYRWHATLSEKNEKWTEEEFKDALEAAGCVDSKGGEIDWNKITEADFGKAAWKVGSKYTMQNVKEWTFGGLERDKETGAFSSEGIAQILMDATEDVAGAYGARRIPEVMKVIEVMGIKQARSWGACSMNEFRKFFGLKPYSSFDEWNSDKSVAAAAKALYRDIDNLELYVGLQAEDSKKPGPGAGLCPGYTISRAILADAVCLTRGDRFLTVECTTYNLTTYGYRTLLPSTQTMGEQDGSYGGNLTRLFYRLLPAQYPVGSALAHFPFLAPSTFETQMKQIDQEKGTKEAAKYLWSRPQVPAGPAGKLTNEPEKAKAGFERVITSYEGAREILTETVPVGVTSQHQGRVWSSGYEDRIKNVLGGGIWTKEQKVLDLDFVRELVEGHVPHLDGLEEKRLRDYFVDLVWRCVGAKEFANADAYLGEEGKGGEKGHVRFLDVMKDLVNLIPVKWVCEEIAGIPFKRDSDGDGSVWTEEELVRRFGDVCQYIFVNNTPEEDWPLRESSVKLFKYFSEHVVDQIKQHASWFHAVKDTKDIIMSPNRARSTAFLHKLVERKGVKTPEELAELLFVETVITARHWSQAVGHVLDAILPKEGEVKAKISTAEFKSFASNVFAQNPIVSGVHRTALQDTRVPGVNENIVTGERVFVSFIDAYKSRSSNAAKISGAGEYGILGVGEYGLMSPKLFDVLTPHVVEAILSLSNLKRGPGQSGKFNKFTEDTQSLNGAPQQIYIDAVGALKPFPDSLVIEYTAQSQKV